MPRTQNKSNSGAKFLTTLVVLGAVTTATLFAYVKYGPGAPAMKNMTSQHSEEPKIEKPVQSQKQKIEQDEASQTASLPHEVEISTPHYQDNEVIFSKHKIKLSKSENPYIAAVNGFLGQAKVTPKEAIAKSAHVENGVLVIEFDQSFNQTHGTDDERTLLHGITESAKQFKGVKAVRFMADGQRIQSLGNVDLTEDLSVDE